MAIKKIKFTETDIIDKGEISFVNSNIVSIVGVNGSGKTILLEHLKKSFEKGWVEQVVQTKDFEKIEKELISIFSVGDDEKNSMNLQKKLKMMD